ncbi:MAG: HupE/UreJ family protein, partial [Sphingomicrobium sp.]
MSEECSEAQDVARPGEAAQLSGSDRLARVGAFARGGAMALMLLLLIAIPAPAQAHEGTGLAGGFLAGFAHPVSGFDHMLAMISVG